MSAFLSAPVPLRGARSPRAPTCARRAAAAAARSPRTVVALQSGGATLASPVKEAKTQTTKRDPGGKYKVLIFNDSFNSMEHVAKSLLKVVPGLSQSKAWSIMKKSHETGSAVVGVWVFELAEAYCDGLRGCGIGSDIEAE